MLQPSRLAFFFLLHLRLEMTSVSILVSVLITAVHSLTEHTITYTAKSPPSMLVRFILCFFWLDLSQLYYITCKLSVAVSCACVVASPLNY